MGREVKAPDFSCGTRSSTARDGVEIPPIFYCKVLLGIEIMFAQRIRDEELAAAIGFANKGLTHE